MTHDSKRLQIQRWLSQGHTLTPLQALRKFRCFSLSQRIGELKRERWPIKSELVKSGGSRVSKYWMAR